MLRALAILALAAACGAPAAATGRTPQPTAKAAAARSAPHTAEVYSRWIEDLPVMPGLTETDGGYSFEIAQGGRLAEARLHGVVKEEVVRGFYASALPPLGWQAEKGQPFLYHRGRERLIFHVTPAKPLGVLAVFVLSPRTAPPSPPADSPAAP